MFWKKITKIAESLWLFKCFYLSLFVNATGSPYILPGYNFYLFVVKRRDVFLRQGWGKNYEVFMPFWMAIFSPRSELILSFCFTGILLFLCVKLVSFCFPLFCFVFICCLLVYHLTQTNSSNWFILFQNAKTPTLFFATQESVSALLGGEKTCWKLSYFRKKTDLCSNLFNIRF